MPPRGTSSAGHWSTPAVDQGLAVYQAPARDLATHARAALHHDEQTLERMLNDMGRAIGPPWRRDEKDATLAAWLAWESATD